jgi:hypothetical protein
VFFSSEMVTEAMLGRCLNGTALLGSMSSVHTFKMYASEEKRW